MADRACDVASSRYMAAPAVVPAVEWAWQRQSVWSKTADRLKSGQTRARHVRLGLTTAGAALAVAGSQLKPVSNAAALAVALLAAVVLATVALLSGQRHVEQMRRWMRARSLSEALKAEIFLFLTKSGNYADADRDERLEAEVQRLEREAHDLVRYFPDVQPKTGPLPPVQNVETYLKIRVHDSQIQKYQELKAGKRRLRLSKLVEVTLALAAAALAATATVSANLAAWAAVVTTAAAAVAVHVAAERYEFLWVEYSRSAGELQRLVDRRTAPDGRRLSDGELVMKCEDVISVQNQAWMAKWGEG